MSILEVRERIAQGVGAELRLTLPFERRQKSRQRTQLDDGRDVSLALPRGTVLTDGDRLRAETGEVIEVRAANEDVSTVRGSSHLELLRAAYHLGNRHVPLQVESGWLRYLRDHVLDDMVRELGLAVSHESAPFIPESGAYSSGHTHSGTHHHHD